MRHAEPAHPLIGAAHNKSALEALIGEEEQLMQFLQEVEHTVLTVSDSKSQQEAFSRLRAIEKDLSDETSKLDLAIGAAKAEIHLHSISERHCLPENSEELQRQIHVEREELRRWTNELHHFSVKKSSSKPIQINTPNAAADDHWKLVPTVCESLSTAPTTEREAELAREIARYFSLCHAMSRVLRVPSL